MSTQHFFYGTARCDRCPSSTALPAHRVRQDARVYLAGYPGTETVEPSAGTCIGAVCTARTISHRCRTAPMGSGRAGRGSPARARPCRCAHAARTGQPPGAHRYFKVLHLSHVPPDEDLGMLGNPWACKYHEDVPDDPPILIATWGHDHDSQATRHAICAIHAHLDTTGWHRDEMLFYLQDQPAATRVRAHDDHRPILPRPPEDLENPLSLDDPAFQARVPELADSLRTYILAHENVMELDE